MKDNTVDSGSVRLSVAQRDTEGVSHHYVLGSTGVLVQSPSVTKRLY